MPLKEHLLIRSARRRGLFASPCTFAPEGKCRNAHLKALFAQWREWPFCPFEAYKFSLVHFMELVNNPFVFLSDFLPSLILQGGKEP